VSAWAVRYLKPLGVLVGSTWKEGLRRRLIIVGLLLTVAFLVLYGLGAYFAFREVGDLTEVRVLAAYQLLSFGIFVCSFLGTMLVIFSAAGVISGDSESGLLQPLVARPLGRWQVLVGKYLGFISLFLAYQVLLSGSVIMLTRLLADFSPPQPFQTLAFLALQGMVLLALVSLISSVLAPVPTGIVAFMAFGLSFIGGVVRQIGMLLSNETAEVIGRIITYLLPSDNLFRMALSGLQPPSSLLGDILGNLGPFGIPVEPTTFSVVYAIVYLAACLGIAVALFARRDL